LKLYNIMLEQDHVGLVATGLLHAASLASMRFNAHLSHVSSSAFNNHWQFELFHGSWVLTIARFDCVFEISVSRKSRSSACIGAVKDGRDRFHRKQATLDQFAGKKEVLIILCIYSNFLILACMRPNQPTLKKERKKE